MRLFTILDTITIPSPFFGLAHDRRLLVGGDITGQNNVVIAPASFDTRRSRVITLGELDEFGPIFGFAVATPAQWLSATPRSRVLQPGESMTVDVKVNPASLGPGAHRARLLIEGAHADSEAVTVPVSAQVGEPPGMTLSAPEIELPMARETTMPVTLANLPSDADLAGFDIRVNWDNSAADVLEVAEGDASFERFDVALSRRAGAARISGSFATAPAGELTLAELNVSAVCRAVPAGTAVELSVSHPRGGVFDAEGNRVPVSSEPGSVTCVRPGR